MTDKQIKQVHTTIPEKYFNYAKNNKLSWNELLIKAIEVEMQADPKIIKERLGKNDRERTMIQTFKHVQVSIQTCTSLLYKCTCLRGLRHLLINRVILESYLLINSYNEKKKNKNSSTVHSNLYNTILYIFEISKMGVSCW